MEMTEAEYREADSDYQGYCSHCKELTHDSCEPDAHKYECPVCERKTVYGIQEALLMGLITIGE